MTTVTDPLREALELHAVGLEQLLAAVHADDPKRELLVRVGDLMRETRTIDAALSASQASVVQVGSGWLPIETAPKDGTEVWAFNGEQARMKWIEGDCYAIWIWADELLSEADPEPEQPTHWQPLPTPPSDALADGGVR